MKLPTVEGSSANCQQLSYYLIRWTEKRREGREVGRCAYIVYLRLCRIQTDRFATGGKGEEPKESGELDRPKGNLKADEHILKEEDRCYRVRYKIEPYLTFTYMLSLSWLHFMYPLSALNCLPLGNQTSSGVSMYIGNDLLHPSI